MPPRLPQAVAPGVVSVSVEMTGPAVVRAGVPCVRSDDVRVHPWTKLTANCACNALSALSQQRYGVVAADAGCAASWTV